MPTQIPIDESTLAASVESAGSWSDLLRSLGFAGRPGSKSIARVRALVEEHGLPTDHLCVRPGPRRTWTVEDLREAVLTSNSWRGVEKALNANYNTVRRVAAKEGFDTSHLDARNHMAPPLAAPLRAEMSAENLRYASERLAESWFILHGFEVYRPSVDKGVDLLVYDGDYSRVQVKTSTYANGAGWHVGLTRSPRTRSPQRGRYAKGEVDELFAVSLDGLMYRIPFDAIAGMGAINLGGKYEKYRVEMFLPATV